MAGFNLPGDDEAEIFTLEKFGTLNTKSGRPAIKDEEFAYVMNFIQLGDGNLRTMWAEAAAIFTSGKTIINVCQFSLTGTSFAAVFFSDGTAVQVNLTSGATVNISASPLFYVPGNVVPTASQWQSKYLIITTFSTSGNGYFVWDGAVLYQAGTVSPDITISVGGSDYTGIPTVTANGGSGSGATFLAMVANGAVVGLLVTNPGTGYLASDGTVQLNFSGGGSDTGAVGAANSTTTGGVAAVAITNSGTGATTASVVTFSGGGGSGAQAVITGLVNGAVTEISITNPGTGYSSAPSIAISGSSGFSGTVDVRYGQMTAIAVLVPGTGYNDSPQVVISPPDSASLPVLQAEAVALVAGGAVVSFTVTQPGLGYTRPPTVTVVGANRAAQGLINLMPYGILGSTLETYQDSVWVGYANKASFTAPGTVSNFATSAGGGSFVSTSSFQRAAYTCFKQTNGFLYLLSDSSIDVVSNVTTSALNGVATTSFNIANVDPQTGAAWRDSVTVFGRAIIFANSSGIYALYGGAAEKISSPLDTLIANASFDAATPGVSPTSAVATIFGVRCYFFNFTTVDSYTGLAATIMAGWDGNKWFLASQLNTMVGVLGQEFFSILTAYGWTATSLYAMFKRSSTSLAKTYQTKLRAEPTPIIYKQVNDAYITAELNQGSSAVVQIAVDTETGVGTFKNYTIGANNLLVGQKTDGVYGHYVGMTVTTTAPDLSILQTSMLYRPFSPTP